MIVVCDSSPLIALSAIGRIELLGRLSQRITIPGEVSREIVETGAGRPGAAEVGTLPWIESRPVTNPTLVTALLTELDRGEAEAIALAAELKADLLLMDERRGRAVATRLGLRRIGLLAALIEAKSKGLIPSVKPILDDLVARAGFRISPPLVLPRRAGGRRVKGAAPAISRRGGGLRTPLRGERSGWGSRDRADGNATDPRVSLRGSHDRNRGVGDSLAPISPAKTMPRHLGGDSSRMRLRAGRVTILSRDRSSSSRDGPDRRQANSDVRRGAGARWRIHREIVRCRFVVGSTDGERPSP